MEIVTLLAGDAVQLMLGAVEEVLIFARGVTAQTFIGVFRRLGLKGKNQFLGPFQFHRVVARVTDGLKVCFAWTVTGFAAGAELDARHIGSGVDCL